MKKLFLVSLAVLLMSAAAYSQSGWYRVSDSIPHLYIMAMQFTSENTGYASGSYNTTTPGAILRTTNAGLNWQVTQFPYYSADDISFLDNNTGYFIAWPSISHMGSYIFKTTNGGINWVCKDSSYASFFNVKFYDYNTGFIAAKYSGIYKTTNGGDNWVSQTGVDWHSPTTLICIDANKWIVSDGSYKINKTTNGGINWNIFDFTSIGFNSWSMCFINSTTGYSSTFYGKIFKTTNAGNNWVQISSFSLFNSYGNMVFVNENTGYLCGGTQGVSVHKTTNGGYNWTSQIVNPYKYFHTLYFINANTGYAGDNNGMIYKTTNGGVGINQISTEVPSKYSLGQNYPNPFNPTTKIKFSVVSSPHGLGGDLVLLKVYDVMGREVQTLVNESLKPGTYEASFDARRGGSASLNSGVYFYKLIIRHGGSSTNTFTETKKMLLIK